MPVALLQPFLRSFSFSSVAPKKRRGLWAVGVMHTLGRKNVVLIMTQPVLPLASHPLPPHSSPYALQLTNATREEHELMLVSIVYGPLLTTKECYKHDKPAPHRIACAINTTVCLRIKTECKIQKQPKSHYDCSSPQKAPNARLLMLS